MASPDSVSGADSSSNQSLDSISKLHPSYCNVSIGPADLANALGVEVLAGCYAGCLALILGLQAYALVHKWKSKDLGPQSTYLLFFPSLVLVPTFLPLLSPPLDHLVGLVQELVTTITMLVYIRLSVEMIGGELNLLYNKDREAVLCPLGTPPLCCLIPCTKPKLTPRLIRLILLPVKIIVVLSFLNLLVFTGLAYNHIPPPKGFGDLRNLSTLLMIPFMVSTMYTYKIFVSIATERMEGTYPRLRGMLVFFVFVVTKSTDGILTMLQENGVLKPLENLPCVSTKQLLLPLVQLGLLVVPCLVVPRIYSTRWNNTNQQILCEVENERMTSTEQDTAGQDVSGHFLGGPVKA